MQAKSLFDKDSRTSRRAVSAREFALIAVLSIATTAGLASVGEGQASANNASSNAAQNADATTTSTATPQDSLAEAARKAKAQKAQAAAAAKPAKVFTNDNLPTTGGISTVGVKPSKDSTAADAAAAPADDAKGEKYWRTKFDSLRKKLDSDQAELDVLQRELGVVSLQNYSDPVQAMQQGLSQSDIQKKTDAINAKKKDVANDQQALTDAEDDLRKSGGDSGWSR